MTVRRTYAGPSLDLWVLAPLSLVVLFGVVVVYDATSGSVPADASYLRYFSAFQSQMLYAAIGFVLMVGIALTPARRIDALGTPFFCASMLACLALFVPGVASGPEGIKRWIQVGPITVQPSEFLKPALALMIARVVTWPGIDLRASIRSFAWPAGIALFCFLAVEREPDMGTGLVLLAIALAVFFLAGARIKHLVTGSALAMVGLAVAIKLLHFRSGRIPAFFDPEGHRWTTGFQIVHSLVAVARSGVAGVGFGLGAGKSVLPVAGSDYVFATVAEELGLVGSVLVIGGLVFVIMRLLQIASRAPDRRMRLAAGGICLGLAAQVLLNIAVVTNCLPSTGVPLPFISDGGSSMVASLMSVGIVLSLGQSRPDQESVAVDGLSSRPARRGAVA
ncbi:MAG: FtsW/RodA/SpoVE family cell cycle protein [Armatimonadetes bacterium]|nr:FtsW/RodA/SpoVE family cell cycle protein [Armatimonadota bacterium]